MKMKTQYLTKLMRCTKRITKRDVNCNKNLFYEAMKIKNNLSLHFEEQKREKQIELKVNRRKNI